MAAVFDIAEMKRRVAATGSRMGASASSEQYGSAQLLQLLEAIETTLVEDQLRIRRLEAEQGRAFAEFRQLRRTLNDALVGPPRLLWRYLDPRSFAVRADLADRWDTIDALLQYDDKTAAGKGTAKEPGAATAGARPGKNIAVCGFLGLLAAATFVGYEWYGEAVTGDRGGERLPSLFGKGSIDTAAVAPPPNLARPTDGATIAIDVEEESDWAGGSPAVGDADTRHELAEIDHSGSPAAKEPNSSPDQSGETKVGPEKSGSGLALVETPPHSDEEDVSQWLAIAQRQIQDTALTSPEGDNAYETYQRVLSIQPNNQEALAGLEQIGVKYVDLANLAAAKGDIDAANGYAAKARQFAPEHPMVQALAIPADIAPSTPAHSSASAVTPGDPEPSPQTAIKPQEILEDFAVSTDSSGSVAWDGSSDLPAEAMAGMGFYPTLDKALSQSLDAEILAAIPLVVPVYPGQHFSRLDAINVKSGSQDQNFAGNPSNSRGGQGPGGSSGDAGGSGGAGDSGGGAGDSGGGASAGGGGSSGGGAGPGNGGGNGNGHGRGNGKGGGKK